MSSISSSTRRQAWRSMLVLMLLALLFLAVLVWGPVQRALAMAALKRSVVGGEVKFDEPFGRLKVPPAALDKKVTEILTWTFSKAHGYTGKSPVQIYRAAYGDIFREPIQKIEILDPVRFNGNPGASLAWFPRLNQFILADDEKFLSEAAWAKICTGLRNAERLEQLRLGGGNLTDAALAALSNHPSLRIVTIDANHLTAGCRTTFSTMPRLNTLVIRKHTPWNNAALTWAEKDRITAALPGVHVIFRE